MIEARQKNTQIDRQIIGRQNASVGLVCTDSQTDMRRWAGRHISRHLQQCTTCWIDAQASGTNWIHIAGSPGVCQRSRLSKHGMTAAQKGHRNGTYPCSIDASGQATSSTAIFFLSLMTLLVRGSGKPPAGCPKFP